MSNYRDVIKAPIITEKSSDLAQNNNTIVFSVDVKANKTQIKQAVEKIFNVKVEKVNTMNLAGKNRRRGYTTGKTAARKKAIVQLTQDSADIEIFAGL